MALKSKICHFRVKKSKMAAKIQDGGRIFLCLLTKKLDMALKNSHTKIGACCQSVIGPTISACTIEAVERQALQHESETYVE